MRDAAVFVAERESSEPGQVASASARGQQVAGCTPRHMRDPTTDSAELAEEQVGFHRAHSDGRHQAWPVRYQDREQSRFPKVSRNFVSIQHP